MLSLFASNAANWTPMPPCGCGCKYYRAVKMEWHAHPMGVFITDTEDTVHHAVAGTEELINNDKLLNCPNCSRSRLKLSDGYYPRDAQSFSILLMLSPYKDGLRGHFQHGEGKPVIVALFVVVKALRDGVKAKFEENLPDRTGWRAFNVVWS
uniref:Uncharacterized protein n=1 Tax=Globodera rostochiensis TaxID=31243 RepID=A0A914IDT4_GLORO